MTLTSVITMGTTFTTAGIPAWDWQSRLSCSSLVSSSCRGRLLAGGNSDYVAIERDGPVDGGRLISRHQPVRVLSYAHDAVVAPDVVRFAVQKVDRLHLT